MQFLGQRKAQKAQNRTFSRERARQQAFQAEQNSRFEDSLNSTGDITDPAKAAEAAASREAALNAVTQSSAPAAGGYLPGSSSAPSVVTAAAEKAGAKSDAATSALARTLASLGGVDDQMFNNNINLNRNSLDIAQIGGFARGSAAAAEAEMRAAAEKGKLLRALGGIAQQVGGAALGGALGPGAGAVNPMAMSGATSAIQGGMISPGAFGLFI